MLHPFLSVFHCVAFLLPAIASAAIQQPLTVTVAGQKREYILVTPKQPRAGPRPLVVILHGHLGTAGNALGGGATPSPLSAWIDIADRENLFLVALQGSKGPDGHTGWNDCRGDSVGDPHTDDVAFASAVLRSLVDAGRADPHRIYVMGMSNGAMMSLRLALEMRPAPAAIAAVAGLMAQQSACREASGPVSVLLIVGTEDPLVPYEGGQVGLWRRKNRGAVMSAEATRDYWLRVDGLSAVTGVTAVFPHLGHDTTRASKTTYGSDVGPQVEMLTIEHGGHVEPSLRFHYGPIYRQLVGVQNRDLESAEEAWSFFRSKVRP
jgi:polyhydroxybutyrate depolymerase